MTEIQGMYPFFNGWYHLDKNWRLAKKNLGDFVETNILGIKYYTSSCPSIDPLCLSRTSFWTISGKKSIDLNKVKLKIVNFFFKIIRLNIQMKLLT